MSIYELLATHKAKVVERLSIGQKRHFCSHCGLKRATIKLAQPNLRAGGRIYRFLWYCEKCYKKSCEDSLKNYPNAPDKPLPREEIYRRVKKGIFNFTPEGEKEQ